MRTIYCLLATVLVLAGCVAAQTTQPADSSVDAALDALHERGQNLKDFSADVQLTDTDTSLANSITRSGKVFFQNKSAGDARFRVTFDTRTADGKTRPEKIEYKLDNGVLIDRNYRTKKETTWHVQKPGEKVDLLKLGQGPFPLPIGQDKNEVHKLFDVKKIDTQKDDPANTTHLKLTPKPDTRLGRKFSAIDIWVDTKLSMPVRIQTLDKNETKLTTTDLTNVKINEGLNDADFTFPAVNEKEWDLINEPYTE